MTDVRSKFSAPVSSDFIDAKGTPIVVDRSTGHAYVMKDDDHVADLKNGVFRVADWANGDGSVETEAIQAAMDAGAGATVDFGNGLDYQIDASLIPSDNTRYVGEARIFAAPSSISGAMFDCTGKSRVIFDYGLEIDANKANSGAHHGIFLKNGSGNRVLNCYIHDTVEAGILAESEYNLRVVGVDLIDCGANGFSENHGIQLYSITATALEDCIVRDCLIDSAYRKGITVYSDSTGTIKGVQILMNRVTGCGLGGIFLANLSAADQQDIIIALNKTSANYTNIVLADAINCQITNNQCRSSSGGEGITIQDVSESDISHNIIVDSYSIGLNFVGSANDRNHIGHNTVMRSNQGLAAYAPGIRLIGVNYSLIDTNIVVGESSSPKQTHAIYEESASNNNKFIDNMMANTSSGTLLTVTGGASATRALP